MQLDILLQNLRQYITNEQEIEMVVKAYYYAKNLHDGKGQTSASLDTD